MTQLKSNFLGTTFIFDLDGTIADTAPDLVNATNAALEWAGLGVAPAEVIKRSVGYGTKAMLDAALKAQGHKLSSETLTHLTTTLIAHYEAHIADETRLFEGFLDVAQELRARGARLCLCTNKLERLARKLLQALDIETLFDSVVGGDTFAFKKPDPRPLVHLLNGASPAQALMIGDSEADIGAAKAASILSVAVEFGYAAVPSAELGADAILHRYADLVKVASELLRSKNV